MVADRPSARSIAIVDDIQLWPNGIVPYSFDSDLPSASRTLVVEAIERWNEIAGVSFLPVSEVQRSLPIPIHDSIRFVSGEFCASWVGRRGGQQDVWISASCPAGSVMHEIGHVLGLEHEHTRPDRDQYITVHWENITPDKRHNFDTAPVGSRLPGDYDYASIMHYGTHNFSSNGRATISTVDGVSRRIGQRIAPSAGDIDAVNSLYGSDLAVAGQRLGDANDAQLEIFVSNQTSQGAHDVALELNVAADITGNAAGSDDWVCVPLEEVDNTRCVTALLPGSGISRLVLDVSPLSAFSLVSIKLSSKTPDKNLNNNLGYTEGSSSGSLASSPDLLQIASVFSIKAPAQDDPATDVATNGGASSYVMLGGLLLLLVVGQAGGRVDLSVLSIHRWYLGRG